MVSTDVRSIDSLKQLRDALLALSGDWEEVLRQIGFTAERIREHFGEHWPAYWHRQTLGAEAGLQESLDTLARLRAGGPGHAHPATEAQQRVNVARRRLAHCQQMRVRAKRLAIVIDEACQRLAGPLAEVRMHVDVDLPRAAAELAALIDHLSRYAEMSTASPPAPHPEPPPPKTAPDSETPDDTLSGNRHANRKPTP